MTTTKLMEDIRNLSMELESKSTELRRVMIDTKDQWMDHQMVKNFGEWHSRDIDPPEGQIWASDGLRVWIIKSDGKGIPKVATAVRYWTAAYIPAPPMSDSE